MVHDLQFSRQCYKISRNVGNMTDLLFFCNKICFLCDSERFRSQGPEISTWWRHTYHYVRISMPIISPEGMIETRDRLKIFHMLNLTALLI